ncbi:MAG: hypothetical protein IIA73_09885 [Proteobacteria bacterium]|nr:hypothetical protein [Pseudomonadota bacterium]
MTKAVYPSAKAKRAAGSGLRIAVAVKQIPRFEVMELTADGRLKRDGVDLEMNAYCRRAVSKGVEIAAATGGRCTVFTLGPEPAADVLREAVACGADAGVLITDPAFAGSDTLATARALAAALRREGPFDLVLVGRNSVDADTGQVGPEIAELMDLPFLCGVREMTLEGRRVDARLEHDDGWVTASCRLPAVLSVAERLCAPAKAAPEARAAVSAGAIRRLAATDLGPGPWGFDGSPTRVGEVRVIEIARDRMVLTGSVREQAHKAVMMLAARGALTLPDGDAAAALCDATHDRLDRAGMPAYEISNFARAGAESRHNLTYWRAGDYVGVGPGAHGRLTEGSATLAVRQVRSPERWHVLAVRGQVLSVPAELLEVADSLGEAARRAEPTLSSVGSSSPTWSRRRAASSGPTCWRRISASTTST